jgi:hypothetical protein
MRPRSADGRVNPSGDRSRVIAAQVLAGRGHDARRARSWNEGCFRLRVPRAAPGFRARRREDGGRSAAASGCGGARGRPFWLRRTRLAWRGSGRGGRVVGASSRGAPWTGGDGLCRCGCGGVAGFPGREVTGVSQVEISPVASRGAVVSAVVPGLRGRCPLWARKRDHGRVSEGIRSSERNVMVVLTWGRFRWWPRRAECDRRVPRALAVPWPRGLDGRRRAWSK